MKKHEIVNLKDGEPFLCIEITGSGIKSAVFVKTGTIIELLSYTNEKVEASSSFPKHDDIYGLLITVMEQYAMDFRKGAKCLFSISGQQGFIRQISLPACLDNKRLETIINFEARQNIPFSMEDVYLDWALTLMGDYYESSTCTFLACQKKFVDVPISIIKANGFDPILVSCSSVESFNAFTFGINKTLFDDISWKLFDRVMLLDIGDSSTSMSIIDSKGERIFSRCIPIAGKNITQQFSKEFGIGIPEAEAIKQMPYFCVPRSYKPIEEEDVQHVFKKFSLKRIPREGSEKILQDPNQSDVEFKASQIVYNIMSQLCGEINRSLNVYRSQSHGEKPGAVILTGGSSSIKGIHDFFEDKLKIDVFQFDPLSLVSITNSDIDLEKTKIEAAGLISLALRTQEDCSIPFNFNICPKGSLNVTGVFSSVIDRIFNKWSLGGTEKTIIQSSKPKDWFCDCPKCNEPGECDMCGGKSYLTAEDAKKHIKGL